MIRKNLLIAMTLLLLLPRANAATPQQLYGKSIHITYTNVTTMRPAGSQGPFKTASTGRGLTIYVSTAGRTFLRKERYGGYQGYQVGAAGKTRSGGPIAVQFDGHSMTYSAVFIGGATLVQATFSQTFDSCTAKVLHGKEGNRSSYLFKGERGTTWEIKSSAATVNACSVSDGNAFSN